MIYMKQNVPVIAVNALRRHDRQQFTIAHEIGHLEMRRFLIEDKARNDKFFRFCAVKENP